MPERILVTGANGMVGSAVCDALIAGDFDLVRAVRNATAPGHFPIGEVDGNTDWRSALSGVTTIVHTAARVHEMQRSGVEYESLFMATNVDGTLNLARQAIEAGVSRFIFISTIKVLGDITTVGHPFNEQSPVAPTDAYSRSKAEAEQGLLRLAEKAGMDVVIIRPPLVYGRGVKGNFIRMVSWIRRGIPLPLASIDNRRSLLGLDNLVDFIRTCIGHPAAANEIFLLADDESLSTTELLAKIGDAIGHRARLFYVPRFLMFAVAGLTGKRSIIERLFCSLQIDNAKAKDRLGWRPPDSVHVGLEKMANALFQNKKR